MSPEQAAKHRQLTEQYLNSVQDDLRQMLGRSLNQTQQQTVSQIHNYVIGSQAALVDGDLTRARTLAYKAHLLADDLAKE
jgi:glycerate-2-kinase